MSSVPSFLVPRRRRWRLLPGLLLWLLSVQGVRQPALGQQPAADRAAPDHFVPVVLTRYVTDPMELAVAPDGRVFFVEREGAVKLWDPAADTTRQVGYVPTHAIHNEGMMGLALDPAFDANGWIYVYHTPPGPEAVNEVARYTVVEGRLDPASRVVLLRVPTQRAECCHSGGSLAFGPEGHLYIATGDNTNPFDAGGFAPLDERPGRRPWDAQRTAANTDDLRGKILRIRPLPDGSYAIPAGNLFPNGAGGRPEIYVMGARNPFRISVDPQTGWLYWGDVGPDAGAPDSTRGPAGFDEFNQARRAGNYGWPYFLADNRPYRDHDFATGTPGPAFDPQAPVNDSPHSSGARVLPPAQPALIWYPYGPAEAFPELGAGGRVAMAGPVYRHRAATRHPQGLPADFDGRLFIYEWARGWIKMVELDEAGAVRAIHPFMAEHLFPRPMDLEVGPDGRLYLIEWGTGYDGYNEDARIVRLDYHPGGIPRPDATSTAEAPTPASPALSVDWPPHGGFFDPARPVAFRVRTHGPARPGAQVQVRPALGHDTHTHPLPPPQGARGAVAFPADTLHPPYITDRFAVLDVTYGVPGERPAAAARVVLHPLRMEAEWASTLRGAWREVQGDLRRKSPEVQTVLVAQDGDRVVYDPVNLAGIDAVTLRLMPRQGGTLRLHLDAADGPLLGTVRLAAAPEAAAAWQEHRLALTDPGGTHALVLTFEGPENGPLMKLDWLRFEGRGVSRTPAE